MKRWIQRFCLVGVLALFVTAAECNPDPDPCAGLNCDDGNECTQDLCANALCGNPAVIDGLACDDGDGTCQSGVCAADPVCAGIDCSDGNECTSDLCNRGACSNPSVADGTMCDGGSGTCENGSCTSVDPSVPDAPSALSAVATSSGSVDLMWQDEADNEDAYILERSEVSSTTGFSTVATLPADSQSFSDTGLTPATTYYYRVAASNAEGRSSYSDVATATTETALTAPSPPTNAVVSNVTSSSATLRWTDNSDNESGFEVGRCTGLVTAGSNGTWRCGPGPLGGGFVSVAQVGADATSYTFTGLSADTEYTRFVRAYNAAGSSVNTGARFTTSLGQQTVTLQAIASNAVQSNSLDSSWADRAYPNRYPVVGIVWLSNLTGFPSSLASASLVRFDLSTLQGRTIDSATLELEAVGAPVGYYPQRFDIGTVATSWNPSTVSWNIMANFFYYNAGWQRNFPYPVFAGQTYSIDLAATVQNWANGTFANNGIAFLSSNYAIFPGNINSIDSYEFFVPTLMVTYH